MTLKGMYSSLVGVINIVFLFAMLSLAFRFWSEASLFIKFFLLLAILFFPVLQPVIIYLRLKKQFHKLPKDLKITFDETGFFLWSKDDTKKFLWQGIVRVSKIRDAFVIYITNNNGYVITKNIVGEDFDCLYNFVVTKVKTKK